MQKLPQLLDGYNDDAIEHCDVIRFNLRQWLAVMQKTVVFRDFN